jgi:hypothetical protein
MQGQAADVKPFDLMNLQYKYTEYEFERYWHFFQLFGRLGYNPNTPSEVLDREFERRFGKETGQRIAAAEHLASRVLPTIVGALYPYSAFPMSRGWAEMQPLGDLPHYAMNQGSDVAIFASFDEEADNLINHTPTAKVRPGQTAFLLNETASVILTAAALAETDPLLANNKEAKTTLTDARILARLADFHAERARGAVAYQIWKKTSDGDFVVEAIRHERDAIDAWKRLIKVAGDVYPDNLMFGNPKFGLCGHWKDQLPILQASLAGLEQDLGDSRTFAQSKHPEVLEAMHAAFSPKFDGRYWRLRVVHEPAKRADAGKPLTIAAQIWTYQDPPTELKSVRLRFRPVNQRLDYESLEMKPTGKKDEYCATIPAEILSTQWDLMYYIEIIDDAGNGGIYPDPQEQTPYVVVKIRR